MIRWFWKDASLGRKLTLAFFALSMPVAGSLWIAAWEVGRMETVAATGSLSLMRQTLVSSGDAGFFFGVAGVVGYLILAGFFLRAIAVPYGLLLERLESLAAGETISPIPHTRRKDDLGRMARALAALRASSVQAEARTEAERTRCDEIRRTAEADRRAVMQSLAEGLTALAAANRAGGRIASPRLVIDNAPAAPRPAVRAVEPCQREDDLELRGILTRLGRR